MENEYLGRVYLDGRHVRGFALPLLGEGLIVADAPMVGLELQRWLFPVQDHLLLPENSAAHAHLIEHGYRKEVVGVRMVHGPALVRNAAMIFAEAFGLV